MAIYAFQCFFFFALSKPKCLIIFPSQQYTIETLWSRGVEDNLLHTLVISILHSALLLNTRYSILKHLCENERLFSLVFLTRKITS